jgi:3-oxoacyl-[acyl-carrier protein] reductase
MSERLTSLSRSITGKRAVVTGAASGMGRATAHLFADEGAKVLVVDRVDEGVSAVVAEISSVHGAGSAVGLVADLADASAVKGVAAAAVDAFGGIDIVVNNAGVSLVTSMFQDEESFEAAWSPTLAVNLTAYARLVRASLPNLREAPGGGRVVNIASTEAIVATGGIAAYSASKAGVTGLTRSMAVELGRFGITVNCVCPGPINTGMTAGIPDEAKEIYAKRRVPLRRYGDPEEVAHMTLSLCLPAASFVNGATIPVDGGMVVRH